MMRAFVGCIAFTLVAHHAAASERVPITIRGKVLTLELYQPTKTGGPKGTVLMGSGDVGWVGLAVDLAVFLADQGYAVVGINSRQYLSAFTSGAAHVAPEQVTGDYATIAKILRDRGTLWAPVILAGVSEGAALAVLGGVTANHAWVKGVMTLGLPASAELAWRLKDLIKWITRKDPGEPSFEPKDFISHISPLPLWMIQSTKDEYVTHADYQQLESAARAPKRLLLVDAANHRFTDRLSILHAHVLEGLQWMQNPQ
jgi:dienelactone hydrolase